MIRNTTQSPYKLPPVHPGEILNEEFLRPMNVTQYRLAKAIGVDARRIHAIVHGERAITAETALLLSRFFGNSAGFWMGLQTQYDLELGRGPSCREAGLGDGSLIEMTRVTGAPRQPSGSQIREPDPRP